jgi:hypothetical protein
MMNIAEQLKLNYCSTKVLNAQIGRDPYNPYYQTLHSLRTKQEAGEVVSDLEYRSLPKCGAAYYWSAADGYFHVNFHYNFFHPEYIDKEKLIDQFADFLGVVLFTDCRESEVTNWCSSFRYFVNTQGDSLSKEYLDKCNWLITVLTIVNPLNKQSVESLDTVDRNVYAKVFDNVILYFKQREQNSLRLMNKYSDVTSLKAKDVMNLLGISRQTLSTYVKQGLVEIDSIINGKYRYNKDSVLALLKT